MFINICCVTLKREQKNKKIIANIQSIFSKESLKSKKKVRKKS